MQVFNNGYITLHHADARQLPTPNESIDCVVTSPPYWGLRDYGLGGWVGGDADCDHVADPSATKTMGNPLFNENRPSRERTKTKGYYADVCPKCGAVREGVWLGGVEGCEHQGIVLGNNRNFNYRAEGGKANNPSLRSNECQYCGAVRGGQGIGLESTPDLYVQNMVEVFREVWRVLKPTGTVWLNLGDSYHNYRADGAYPKQTVSKTKQDLPAFAPHRGHHVEGLKSKDLMGMPWRVAFALQADGWYLRSDIIWSKPNPMPESVKDRPTKAHEYIFLLTKNPRYYYDTEAIREANGHEADWNNYGGQGLITHPTGLDRNKIDLAEGFSQPKVMPNATHPNGRNKRTVWEIATQPYPEAHFATYSEKLVEPCILAGCPLGGVVLDPFVGSGTTMAVAQRLNRKGVGTDLSTEYLALASKRLGSIALPMNLGI